MCDEHEIPAVCERRFTQQEERYAAILQELKAIRENQRTWGHRLWDLVRAAILLIFGWWLGNGRH